MSLFKAKAGISKICAVALLCVLYTPSSLWAADKKIDLFADGDKLKFKNSECPASPNLKGCVKVGKGSKNWIKWELDKNSARAGWVLTRLELKLDQIADPAIRQCVIDDLNVDPATGFALDFRVQGNGKWAKNWDNNDCQVAYEVAYVIYARNTVTGKDADSDPIIKNGGRN